MMKALMESPKQLLYALFAIGCVAVWKTLQARATGQYDYILTLSACLQSLAFALLVVETRGSALEGLSEKSLWAFCIAHVTRLSTTVWGEGYVPEDTTGDCYLYQGAELIGVLLVAFQLLKLTTLRASHDVGQAAENWGTVFGMCG